MHRTEGDNNVEIGGKKLFADGPPGTVVTDDWMNAVQEEIAGIIEAAGIILKTAGTETRAQLLAALLGSTGTGLTFGRIGIGVAPSSMTASGLEIRDKGGTQLIIKETSDVAIQTLFNSSQDDAGGNIGLHDWDIDGIPVARLEVKRGSDATSGYYRFSTNNAGAGLNEAVVISQTGRLGVGTSPGPPLHVLNITANPICTLESTDATVTAGQSILDLDYSADADVTGAFFINFQDADGTIGKIEADSAASVAYTTSSDRRLKTNLKPIDSGLKELLQINTYCFDWLKNGKSGKGIIAQELYEIYPEAVSKGGTGEIPKKGKLENGDPVDQGIWMVDYSKLVPLLIKSIQELSAKVKVLESA